MAEESSVALRESKLLANKAKAAYLEFMRCKTTLELRGYQHGVGVDGPFFYREIKEEL